MRSARTSLLCLLVAALGGCSTFGTKPEAAGAASPAAAAPSAAATAAPAKPEPAPVDPSIQRAFETARRALIAGRLDEAERGFKALAQSNPDLGGPHANLGVIYRQSGRLPESVAELEAAVKANPQQPVYQNQLGITYRLAGQFPKAREAYERAIALDPNYAVAYLNLGILYDLYFWDSKHAVEFYDRYLALSPQGDDKVAKWVADIRNRTSPQSKLSRKEAP